jgi:hypothetical protein
VKQGDGTDSHLCRKASRPPTLGTISPAAGPASSTHYRVRSGPPGRDWPDPGRVAWPPSGNYASTAATSTSSASSAPQVRRPRPMTETVQSPGSTHPVTHVPGSPARLSLGDLSRLVSASGGLSAAAGSRALLSMTRSLRAAPRGHRLRCFSASDLAIASRTRRATAAQAYCPARSRPRSRSSRRTSSSVMS